MKDRGNLCNVSESVQVLSPIAQWGSIKIGAGTPPVRIALDGVDGWLSVFHGVDADRPASADDRACVIAPAS